MSTLTDMKNSGPEYTTPGDYLAAADREFAAGNHDAGSILLTKSVHCALAQLAEHAGRPSGTRAELRQFAEWLDDQHDAGGWHARNLLAADIIGDPEKFQALPPDRRIYYSKSAVREFIAALLSYQLQELQNPGDYLTASDREFAAGNYYEGAILLYDSASCAFTRLAKDQGAPCETPADLKNFAVWLDKRHGGDWHVQNLNTVKLFRDNANYRFMAQEDMDFLRPWARDFVKTLSSYHLHAAP